MDENLSNNVFGIKEIKEFVKSFFETENKTGTHDFSHTMRVFHLSEKIGIEENADMEILLPSALLHDVGRSQPGDHAENSGRIAAEILKQLAFPEEKIEKIIYAISVHRYAKGEIPKTLDAKILQDADRIDALGAIGIMRTFSYGSRKLYNEDDPFNETGRKLNDKEYSLDHFYQKLLKLPELMHTKTGKKIAKEREKFMLKFLDELRKEI